MPFGSKESIVKESFLAVGGTQNRNVLRQLTISPERFRGWLRFLIGRASWKGSNPDVRSVPFQSFPHDA
jgi:hypothetical protein